MGFRNLAIKLECLLRGRSGFVKGLTAGNIPEVSLYSISIRQPCVGCRIAFVSLNSIAEELYCCLHIIARPFFEVGTTLQIESIRFGILRSNFRKAVSLTATSPW